MARYKCELRKKNPGFWETHAWTIHAMHWEERSPRSRQSHVFIQLLSAQAYHPLNIVDILIAKAYLFEQNWTQGWHYGKGLIYLRPIFRLTKLAFLKARASASLAFSFVQLHFEWRLAPASLQQRSGKTEPVRFISRRVDLCIQRLYIIYLIIIIIIIITIILIIIIIIIIIIIT